MRVSLRGYLWVMLGVPLVMVPAMVLLGRSDFFLRHGASEWVQANDAIFAMRGRNCELVVWGDSTAMTGLDPAVLERATGLRACNLAVTNAVLAVVGEMPLDHFLANNARPRVLLMQFSPEDFERASHGWGNTIYGEGLLELLRHGSGPEVRRVVWEHPREVMAFAGYAAGYTAWWGMRATWAGVTGREVEERRVVVRNGFFTPPGEALTRCGTAERWVETGDREFPRQFAAGLRARYAGRAGAVLVEAAPIPECDANLVGFAGMLEGVAAVRGLPVGMFNDGRHYTAEGARVVSGMAAAAVRGVLGGR